ncbi:MAG TPA: rhomboid family intramembrane serine protease [Kofleriaceae bacterium]|nr:rhomboid family intramembrane serine protease [Kofleriaceae bacterium]
MGHDPQADDDAWIEQVVKVAGALGFNQMRLRWKLMRWQDGRRKARNRREQRLAHIRYQHKTCPECSAVQDRDEPVCTRCGAKLPRRGMQVLQRIGLTAPQALSVSTVLAIALLGVYFEMWIAAGGGLRSPSGALLVGFGGHLPGLTADEPWRLVTAMFLHAGLWHLGFNLIAIASIGPRIEELYGRWTMLALFVITGTLANVGSEQMGLAGVGIGASGGVMGLIGVAAGHGQRAGTTAGHALRNDMLKWAAYTIVIGIGIGADNWAHAFGVLTGAAFGYAVWPGAWRRPRLLGVRAPIELLGVVATVGALAIICTRTPPAPSPALPTEEWAGRDEEPVNSAEALAPYIAICRQYDTDPTGALAAARALGARSFVTAPDAAFIQEMCDMLYQLRDQCGRGSNGLGGSSAPARATQRASCDAVLPGLSELPERRAHTGSGQ